MEELPVGSEQIEVAQEMPAGVERRLVLKLLGHWRILCGDRKMPAVSDLDPAAIPEIWPHSFLVDINSTGNGHLFKVLGDKIDNPPPGSLAGMRVEDAKEGELPRMAIAYIEEVLSRGVPVSRGGSFVTPKGANVLYRSVLLPLSDDGTVINGILGAANCREVVDN